MEPVPGRPQSRGRRFGATLLVFVLAHWATARGQEVSGSAPALQASIAVKVESQRWFEDAKLGLLISWSIDSLLGKGEAVMEQDKLPIVQYEKLAARFNPTRFDADSWVQLAKSAGARYLAVTSKHPDGFCMFDSKLTPYDVVDATSFGKDPLKALADACRKHQIKLFFYYSLLDWHHPDYFPRGVTGASAGRPDRGDWGRYVAYYQGQIRELCTNYGEIGGIWLDGWTDRPTAEWDLVGTYRMIHELQPAALIANNHERAPFPGEDFQILPPGIPGKSRSALDRAKLKQNLPLETRLTMNNSLGYDKRDTHYKSSGQIIRALLGSAGRGSNLLIYVSPHPDGTIGTESAERLKEVGKWLTTFGSTVYKTRSGPIPPSEWGVSTAEGPEDRPTAVFLHIDPSKLNRPVVLPKGFETFTATRLGATSPLKVKPVPNGTIVEIPEADRTPIDTIVILRPK